MVKLKLNWTPEAEAWLKEIHEYISEDNPDLAIQVVESIYRRVEVLNKFPRIGHPYPHRPDIEIRILLFGHYRIAYRIKSETEIDILGVFHGALDIERHLG